MPRCLFCRKGASEGYGKTEATQALFYWLAQAAGFLGWDEAELHLVSAARSVCTSCGHRTKGYLPSAVNALRNFCLDGDLNLHTSNRQ